MSTMGVTDEQGNVLYGLLYAGSGVPQTSMVGTFLADMVHGCEQPSTSAAAPRLPRSKTGRRTGMMGQVRGTWRCAMEPAVVVRGKLNDPSHIELDKPLSGIRGAVEVTVRPVQEATVGSPLAVLQAMRALPDLEPGDVDELERMIEAGKLPTRSEGLFDVGPRGMGE